MKEVKPVRFLIKCRMKERKEAKQIPRLLARASGRMNLPLTEMVNTARRTSLWGADEELSFRHVEFRCLGNI